MTANTKIEWADDTVNFWWGCTQISPGCDHCYAMTLAKRFGPEWNGPIKWRGDKATQELLASNRKAVKTGSRRYVFINSMGDTFDKNARDWHREELFRALRFSPSVTGLVLTKRIGNVVGMTEKYGWPSNAWLGITVVNQEEADRDIPKLLAAKAALKIPRIFLSVEPMLGPVHIDRLDYHGSPAPAIDWVICGGESGADARRLDPRWVQSLEAQCRAASVPFFFKQWGEFEYHCTNLEDAGAIKGAAGRIEARRVGKKAAGRKLYGVEHNGRPQP